MGLQEREKDRERLAALLELDLLHGEQFPELDRLVALAADICNANIAAFTVHDDQRAVQVSTSFGERLTMPRSQCICSITLSSGQTVVLADARADAATARFRHVAQAPFVRSYAGSPVGADRQLPVGV